MTNIKYLIPLLCVLFVGCTNTSNKENLAYQFVKPLPAKSPFKGSPMLSTSEYVSDLEGLKLASPSAAELKFPTPPKSSQGIDGGVGIEKGIELLYSFHY